MRTLPGDPRWGSPSALFRGCQESETAGVHTQRLSRHSNLGGPHKQPGQLSQVLYKSNPERGPLWLYQLAESVHQKKGRHSAEAWGGKEKKVLPGRDEQGRQAPVPRIQEKHPTAFSGVLFV